MLGDPADRGPDRRRRRPVAALGAAGPARRRRACGRPCWRSPAPRARPAPRTTSPRCSRGAGPTVATAGNLNNELGVPLTVLRCTAETRLPRRRDGRARHRPHRRAVPDRAARRGRRAQRRHRPPRRVRLPRGDRAGQGRDRRGARPPTAPRCSTPTTTWSRRWRDRTAGAGADLRRRRRDVDVAGATSTLDDLGRPSFELGHDGEWRHRPPRPGRRAPGRQRRRRRRHGARRRASTWPTSPDALDRGAGPPSPLADGAARAGRRAGRRQRRLQRQPRLDGGRARRAGRDRRARGGARTVAVLGEMLELGDGRRRAARARSGRYAAEPRRRRRGHGRRRGRGRSRDGARRTPGLGGTARHHGGP